MYKYVITGDGMMAQVVHSDLNWFEFRGLIEEQTKKLHPKGRDRVWRFGVLEFVNPEVKSLEDFGNYLPALIGIK